MPQGGIYDEFLKIVQTGTEEEAKAFLVTHIKEFPPEEQQAIILAFVQDAAEEKREGAAAVAEFQKEGIDLFQGLDRTKKELERQGAMLDIKENL